MDTCELYKIRVPIGREIGDNNCTYDSFDVCALRLDAGGLSGWGFGEKAHGGRFAKPVSWKEDMADEAALRAELASVWPELEGRPAAELLEELPCPWAPWRVCNPLHAALRMALWDLRGREAGEPLFRHLGGSNTPDTVFAYASPCAFPQTDDWAAEFFATKVADGFSAVKVKVGHEDIERDIERLRRVRDAVGPEVEINVDGNTAWDGSGALRWMELVADAGVALGYVEDPVWPEDLEGYRLLARESPVRIVGHDYIPDPVRLRPLLDTGALGAIRLRDGIDYCLAGAQLAEEYDLPLIQGNTFGEHAIHFALTGSRVERMEFADLGWNALFEEPVAAVGGRLKAPSGNGLGLVPKPALLENWREG